MGHRHSAGELLDSAVTVAEERGLNALSFRLVAERAGTSDRMVVYYFPTKQDLMEAVLVRLTERLQALLVGALVDAPVRGATPAVLLSRLRPVVTAPENELVLRLHLEAVGLAVAGVAPFATIAPVLLQAWVDWLDRVRGSATSDGAAEALVATVDGLVIIRALMGRAAADRAWDAVTRPGGPPPGDRP